MHSMNYITSLIVILAMTAVLGVLSYVAKIKSIKLTLPRKIVAIILTAVAFIRYMIAEEKFMEMSTQGLNMYSPFGDDTLGTIVSMLLIWFTYSALLTVIMDTFFEARLLRNMSYFFALPVLLADICLYTTYITGVVGAEPYAIRDPRVLLMAIEIGLALALLASRVIEDGRIQFPTKRETFTLLGVLPCAVIAIMPSFTPWVLVGDALTPSSLKLEEFTFEHRLILYFAIILPYIIYRVLRDKTPYEKRVALIYMNTAFLWAYQRYWTLANITEPWSWPLHLCNTAMFIVPLCLIFRMKRLFNFTLFINVLGAFFALILPDLANDMNVLEYRSVHYWLNHYSAFFMPVLLIALKMFERPKFRQWVYSLISFAVYFFSVVFINAWFTALGHNTDYFFVNSDFIAEKLGQWAENIRKLTLTFTIDGVEFLVYPLYQILFFLVFVLLSVGVWFLYAVLFKSWDEAEERRSKERDYQRMKKELTDFLGGRSIDEPITGDSSPKLALKHFSKKYGANKHYSVEDVSFEVHGGEIFGFLGPNGAGKSTIIKSVVGIQTITEGSIEVCGYDVEKQSVQAKHNLGFVPDHYALYENLTGREYINYIADLYEVSREERDERIEHYVTAFQLTGSFDNQMKTYSHGMKQKIAIMAALVHNPKLWILDEPLTGLDPTSIHEVKECMKAHAAAGNIVFFSSHIIDVVEKICDRIAIIKKGKLRACLKVSELEERGIDLENFYLSIINAPEDAVDISISDTNTAKPIEAQS